MGFETLKNIFEANKLQAELDREKAENPTECPNCIWELSVNNEGQKSCPICGRIWR